ncbi:hypothetical protein Zmor_004618 [Zophobas morio]|uniref:Choline transporter-like protein n=1 Tax=Zophobas morio TaxID=2755281 RepID=A0AA38IWC8_9CUCU|nr:hypothetical protein Zmor_004618 [Zophobas morio]
MASLVRDRTDPEFKKVPPLPLAVFKNISPTDYLYLPEIPENRSCTNVFFLFPAALLVFGWLGFSIYMTQILNVNRFLYGEDGCGNICGIDNVEVTREGCEAKDYTDYPIAWYQDSDCVHSCEEEDRVIIFNRCMDANKITRHLANFLTTRGKIRRYVAIRNDLDHETFTYVAFHIIFENVLNILLIILVTLIFCFLLLVGLRYCTACTFWTFIVLLGLVLGSLTLLSWYAFTVGGGLSQLLLGVIFTTFLIFYFVFLWYLFKSSRYLLVIAIFEEAMLAIFKIPLSMFAPIMSLLFLFGVVYGLSFYMIMVLLSQTPENNTQVISAIYMLVSIAATYFLHALVNGCQCMVVAGCVASYYFARDKTSVGNGVFFTSIYVMTVYHLGTICAAALIMTILAIIRYTIEALAREAEDHDETTTQVIFEMLTCCCNVVEEIVEYIAKKAYIMTAIHGKGLLESGKRGMRLIWHFLLDTIFIDCVAHCTLFIASCFIFFTVLAIAVALLLYLEYLMKIILFPTAMLIGLTIYYIVTMINVAIETIFLCMCEDMLLNDGSLQKPYYMTQHLAELKTLFLTLAQEAQQLREEHRVERQRHNQDEYENGQPPYQYPNQYQQGQQPNQYPNPYQQGQPQYQYPNQYQQGQPPYQNQYRR